MTRVERSRAPCWMVFGVAAGMSVWLWPASEAEACSCIGESWLVAPMESTHPANAGFLLGGNCWVNPELFSVTVDGVEATLVAGQTVPGPYLSVAIEPEPMVGQEVSISQCEHDEYSDSCPNDPTWIEVGHYVAAEPDLVAPPAAGAASLAHVEGEFFPACDEADLKFVATVTGLDQGDEERVLYVATLETPGGEVMGEDATLVEEPDADRSFEFYRNVADLAAPAEDHCVRVVVTDLADNLTEVVRACGSVPESGGDTTTATSGDDGDATTDGVSTTDGASTTVGDAGGGDDETGGGGQQSGAVDRGCACASGSGGSSTWVMLLLPVLARRRDPR